MPGAGPGGRLCGRPGTTGLNAAGNATKEAALAKLEPYACGKPNCYQPGDRLLASFKAL